MGALQLNTRQKQLAIVALSSTIFSVPSWALDVSAAAPSGAITTSVITDDVVIKPDGHITDAATAVTIDSPNKLTIEADNVSVNPPGLTTNGNVPTVKVTSLGSTATITIGANSGIAHSVSSGEGVEINTANNVTIDNSGSITNIAQGDAVDVNSTTNTLIENRTGAVIRAARDDGISIRSATNTIINNETGAIIESQGPGNNNSGIQFSTGSPSGTINNSGTIQNQSSSNAAGAIYVFSGNPTVAINNNAGGVINAANGDAITQRTTAGVLKIDITNAGTISAGRDSIFFTRPNTGNITNQSTGVISASNKVAGHAIRIDQPFVGNITNEGTVTNTAFATGGNAIFLNSTMTGDINNSGTMTTNNGSTLLIANVLTGNVTNTGTIAQLGTGSVPQDAVTVNSNISGKFDNQGTISTAFSTALNINNTIVGGIFNSGTISAPTGKLALDIGSTTNLTQTGGSISGNVDIANNNTSTFTGGTVDGTFTFSNGLAVNTLNVENTSFTGQITDNSLLSTLNVTNNFSTQAPIIGFDNTNVNAGTLDINAAMTTGTAGTKTLNINNGSTVNLNSTLTGGAGVPLNLNINVDSRLNINQGATLQPGAGGTLPIITDGFLKVADTATVNATSLNHTAPGSATYEFNLTDTNTFSVINLTGGGDVTGDTIKATLTGDGYIKAGDTFKVIDGGALITGSGGAGFTIAPTNSQTLTFVNANGVDGNDVTLTAVRAPFGLFTETENSQNVANALDALVNDPTLSQDLQLALGQVDTQLSKAEVSNALESLLPDNSGGLVEISQNLHNRGLHTVEGRLDQARALSDIVTTLQAGDAPYYGMGAWGRIYAAYASQKDVDTFLGYTATTIGLITGLDKSFNKNLKLGVAFSYANADVDGRGQSANETDIRSLQILGYGTYNWDAWYVDFMASAALNSYKAKRQIAVGTFRRVARADYKAWLYSGKFQAGYTIANGKYRIVPMAGLQYDMLDIDGYTESTAGGVSLAVEPRNVPEIIGSAGIRFSAVNEYVEALYVPEIRFFAHYDFLRDNVINTANFVSNGSVFFESRTARPDPITFNIGTALTAYANNLVFAANYDLEFRNQYFSHYGSFKVRYEW